jgi:hypothetical protein
MNFNPNNISTAYILALILIALIAIFVMLTKDKTENKGKKRL